MPIVYENKYGIRKCRIEDFHGTTFREKYFERMTNEWGAYQYCVDDPNNEAYMIGTRDDWIV